MGKTKPHSQSPSKTPNTPVHPILNNWSINRKLEKIEQGYRCDQQNRPAEIKSSSIANPAGAAISYRVERLRQYAEEIEGIYDAEIRAGRVADTADLWAEVYKQILLVVKAQTNSLLWNLGFELMRTGGGTTGEQESAQEAGRELNRLVAGLESKLATACNHAEQANVSAPDVLSAEDETAARAAEKLADPSRHSIMTLPEVMCVLPVSRAQIYRYLDEGNLRRAGLNKKSGKRSRVLVLTRSVKNMLEESPE